MGKSSLWRIPRDHFRTLRDATTNRPRVGDFVLQIGIPLISGMASYCAGLGFKDVTQAVVGISIVAGLLFSMAVFLFQLRINFPNDPRITQTDKTLIDECMKNVLWAIVWGLLLVVYLIICQATGSMGSGKTGSILTGIAVAAAVHFLLVIAMCLKRLHRAYERIAMHRP